GGSATLGRTGRRRRVDRQRRLRGDLEHGAEEPAVQAHAEVSCATPPSNVRPESNRTRFNLRGILRVVGVPGEYSSSRSAWPGRRVSSIRLDRRARPNGKFCLWAAIAFRSDRSFTCRASWFSGSP